VSGPGLGVRGKSGPGLGVEWSRSRGSHRGTVLVRSTDVHQAVEEQRLQGGHVEHLEGESGAATAPISPSPLEGGVNCTSGGHMAQLGHA